MHQKLSEIFEPVSEQLVQSGSKLEKEHLAIFRLATAIINGIDRRVFDWPDLMEGLAIDVRNPEQDPFCVISRKADCYVFLVKVRGEVWAEEGFGPENLENPDWANCLNAFLNEGFGALRARRHTATV